MIKLGKFKIIIPCGISFGIPDIKIYTNDASHPHQHFFWLPLNSESIDERREKNKRFKEQQRRFYNLQAR